MTKNTFFSFLATTIHNPNSITCKKGDLHGAVFNPVTSPKPPGINTRLIRSVILQKSTSVMYSVGKNASKSDLRSLY